MGIVVRGRKLTPSAMARPVFFVVVAAADTAAAAAAAAAVASDDDDDVFVVFVTKTLRHQKYNSYCFFPVSNVEYFKWHRVSVCCSRCLRYIL